jgi:hypothetical protein
VNGLVAFIRGEPVLIMGGVQAGVGLACAFGLRLSGEQTGAIMIASAAVLSIICRQVVTPTATTPIPPDALARLARPPALAGGSGPSGAASPLSPETPEVSAP